MEPTLPRPNLKFSEDGKTVCLNLTMYEGESQFIKIDGVIYQILNGDMFLLNEDKVENKSEDIETSGQTENAPEVPSTSFFDMQYTRRARTDAEVLSATLNGYTPVEPHFPSPLFYSCVSDDDDGSQATTGMEVIVESDDDGLYVPLLAKEEGELNSNDEEDVQFIIEQPTTLHTQKHLLKHKLKFTESQIQDLKHKLRSWRVMLKITKSVQKTLKLN